ncbi:hypothetical protein M3685_26640 [Heyndrickxia oleronia]|uniref:hypothetical protein n=1 Tax=Heyndrickxia oleronia TaxID=38875 RepID=UPI00203F3E6A|nr:hypothetical protein [Heyndrickxia oleronia]MCM3457450.1 hypothetical protein [Heyndrickxia oleronia]
MNIVLKAVYVQWKNPILGQPTRAIEEHYYARRIIAIVNGEERQFRFMASELPFHATEDDMVATIENQINAENIQEQSTNAE